MGQRLDLHETLVDILGTGYVYYQPPATIKMNYPCIVYNRDKLETTFADDNPYSHQMRYQITVIDRDPDSEIPGKIAELPKCVFDRFYTADNLNHDVFKLFF